MNAFGQHKLFAGVPTGLGEVCQNDAEHFCGDGRQQEQLRLARGGMDKTVDYISSKINNLDTSLGY